MSEAKQEYRSGLTLRSFVVCLVSLFVMGIWIEYEELINTYGGPLAENSPPNSAVGVVLAVMAIGGLLYLVRRPLRLVASELVVIYAALVIAAPLMTQGMWHRFFGLVTAIPYKSDFKSYESLPPMLWPHGPNLCANGQFRKELEGYTHSGGGSITWTNVDRGDKGIWRSPVLSNDGNTGAVCRLSLVLDRRDASGREVLVAGESYLFSMLVKVSGFSGTSAYIASMNRGADDEKSLLTGSQDTKPTMASPEGFERIGVSALVLPETLGERITLDIEINGAGQLIVQDIQFFNVQAVAGLFSGRKYVDEKGLSALGPNERDFTSVRPERMLSVAGLKYLVAGHIPLRQWVQPAIAWGLLVGALFLGFFGLNVLMRKQWVDNERFTFPLTILPKNIFAMENGRFTILRNWIMWVGFAITLPIVLSKGINYYVPAFPTVGGLGQVDFKEFVNNPTFKAYLQDVGIGVSANTGFSFCILAIALLIETDVLFAMWSVFLLFQLWNLFGKVFNYTQIAGYPWEHQQTMGGFIAFAVMALIVGRHHLKKVFKTILGRQTDLDQKQEVVSYRTALLMVLAALGMFVGWGIWVRMGAMASLFFFGYMLLCGFAASKIRAEMGAPWGYLTPYFGMQFVAAIGGFAIFKSTGMLVATIAAGFICPTCFLLMAPAQVEMMELGRHFKVKPRDIGAGLTLGLLGGLFIGGFVVLCWAYGFGAVNLKTPWPYSESQNYYFNGYRVAEASADRALAAGTLHSNPATRPLDFVNNVDAKGLGIGAVITGTLAFLRAKLAWFPFHPLGYVLASTFFMKACWFTLFVAWAIRLLLFRIGGAHVVRRGLIPFCIGMFLACIASILVFDVVGVWMRTQGLPDVYSRMP
jgi:hypothetical protein